MSFRHFRPLSSCVFVLAAAFFVGQLGCELLPVTGTPTATSTPAPSGGGTATPTPTPAGNQDPTANAGTDRTVEIGQDVSLDGSGSSDPEGGTLTFAWDQTEGNNTVTLTDETTDAPSFTAPDAADVLTFELTVTDPEGATATDTVDITVELPPALLFVVNNGASVTVYSNPEALDGEIAARNQLDAGSTTSLFQPRSIIVTPGTTTTDEILFVSRQNGGIVGYENALEIDEDTPADRTIDGNNTLLESPISFAYDEVADRLFVGNVGNSADPTGVLVFDDISSTAFNGSVVPDRHFGPSDREPFNINATSLVMTITAMCLDNGLLFVADTSVANTTRILVYDDPETADDRTEPIRTITSSSLGNVEDLVVDEDDNLLIVDSGPSVLIFNNASTIDGDNDPDATLTVGRSLVELEGIVVSERTGAGFLADTNNDVIYSFDDINTLDGTVNPDRELEGTDTLLRTPRQMFLLEP